MTNEEKFNAVIDAINLIEATFDDLQVNLMPPMADIVRDTGNETAIDWGSRVNAKIIEAKGIMIAAHYDADGWIRYMGSIGFPAPNFTPEMIDGPILEGGING